MARKRPPEVPESEIFKDGTRVRIQVDPEMIADDWTAEGLRWRREKGTGWIIRHHDAHGLSYEVGHDGGGPAGAYEHHELKEI